MQSGTIMSVKTVEGTSVKSKIWGSFSFYFLQIFWIYVSLLIVSQLCIRNCSSNLFFLCLLLLIRELTSVITN